ncbi:putative mitochondrial 3-hydroxyisobutyryl-coenzyme a hydrolase-like protein [Leptomonas pyrrhocoris]|uniref:3-hydroxyisobutyryl-CoA hydrolase n=1 Tax=Leptomonas pyrrhocoris TaxID=157538 RepID=A0A0M9G8K3_LEPPY|nr:putative mitochondrial 3-hydroxyisobutyryl-coenzyme a hydrolase-like protein [Leptomonas pyrrhocoris]XP_015663450.1 putative mitochondrial 3-hydroxyisobutyryl-coenzyme a hydrolase-like protein [Leptomonas pyrrhocoris]KPA85010.1 putative mitochondrial 3-hydroxyisobutyryl-coenzyme a hydrolase-like protein [Leptomonas pyrrhocoris]KPA85011.1 putative mitochondrial 3-hydroxyisobutyryl-coenzyme a hydrolase-like protein [Leptomonas pyrrhocoris]|eukprot:XP_015663449.1 putative mitochondrial 3-hydroxyisobutyryl-coenzyme a hydrolase-like protein [Leptomonas pyrrhocoris]
MVKDLHRLYITEPHPHKDALYVLRGDGRRSFCAGGDVKALVAAHQAQDNHTFYTTEYRVDAYIATMPQAQVVMWAGHVLGSGVGVSLHGRHRVACETTRFAMPETHIGAVNDVGTGWVFSSIPVKGLGAYMVITGGALKGADVYHAGLANHYIPLEKYDAVEAALATLPGEAAAASCLDAFAANVAVPPFTLAGQEAVIAKAFGDAEESTRLQDIMEKLRADDSAFALDTLKLMERISPFGMVLALENMKRQHTPACNSLLDCLRGDFAEVTSADVKRELAIGVKALLVAKEKYPKWTHKSVQDVDVAATRNLFTLPPGMASF